MAEIGRGHEPSAANRANQRGSHTVGHSAPSTCSKAPTAGGARLPSVPPKRGEAAPCPGFMIQPGSKEAGVLACVPAVALAPHCLAAMQLGAVGMPAGGTSPMRLYQDYLLPRPSLVAQTSRGHGRPQPAGLCCHHSSSLRAGAAAPACDIEPARRQAGPPAWEPPVVQQGGAVLGHRPPAAAPTVCTARQAAASTAPSPPLAPLERRPAAGAAGHKASTGCPAAAGHAAPGRPGRCGGPSGPEPLQQS
jgi:hypothetical protein